MAGMMEVLEGQEDAAGQTGVGRLEEQVRRAACDYVRFAFGDLHGIPRCVEVPRRHVAQALKDGIGMFAGACSSGPKCEMIEFDWVEKGFPNCQLRPDPTTFCVLPWSGGGRFTIGEVLCDAFWPPTGQVVQGFPRQVARTQVDRLKQMGYQLFSSFEYEFYLLDKDNQQPAFKGHQYGVCLFTNRWQEFLADLEVGLGKVGVDVEHMHMEYGAGQMELTMTPGWGLHNADRAFRYKESIHEMVDLKGYEATFMSKPLPDEAGSSCHFNHSLWDSNRSSNVFFDPSKEDKLSDVAKHWIAGLIKHERALTAVVCPTFNCYRRLREILTPKTAFWDMDNRLAYIRAKSSTPGSTYLECRLPSSGSNPYLVMSAILAAGIDGINKKLPCPPKKEADPIKTPMSLSEAVEALKADQVMCDALGPQFIEWFCGVKEFEVTKLKDVDMDAHTEESYAADRDIYRLV